MPAAQTLFDTLAGAAGHPVNRPALDAYVTQGQAMAGLRSAQTEEALTKAQAAQEEMSARDTLEASLGDIMGSPAEAHAASNIMRSGFGNAQVALDALKSNLELKNRTALSDPTQLGTPAQTAAQQGVQGKVAEPVNVPNNFATLPGAYQPTVQQTPTGQADTAAKNAEANLHNTQAAAGGFNPGTGGGALDPNAIAFGSYMLYKTGKMPSLGMGGGAGRAAILAGAAQLAQQEAAGQPVANSGFDTAIANGQDFTAANGALGSFARGPLGNQVRALNNVVGHLSLYDKLFDALQNGDTQLFNSVSAKWQQAFGSPAPTNMQAAGALIGPELTKIMTNSNAAGTGEERQAFLQQAGSLANSPEQAHGAISTLRGMLSRQAADLALQYHGATGRGDFAGRYLQPDVAQALELDPHTVQAPPGVTPPAVVPPAPAAGPPPAAGAAPGPARIQSDAEYNALPPGAEFIAPDGSHRKKP